jgi:hypothetical protein
VKLLTAKALPNFTMKRIATDAPSLAKLRREKDAPNEKQSSTDRELPRVALPRTANVAPMRAKALREKEDPNLA